MSHLWLPKSLKESTLAEILNELDSRGIRFVWASCPREGHEEECRLVRSGAVSDEDAYWMLDAATRCVEEHLCSDEE